MRVTISDAIWARALAAADRKFVALAVVGCIAVFILRSPSFVEPAWHTDEGTFAGVAEGIVRGRDIYSEAWESKPPLFLYLYAGIFKLLGAGLLQLKLAAAAAAISSQFLLFLLGRRLMSPWRALGASLLFGVLVGVPFWEGNLALSEIFSMPATILAVWLAVARSETGRGDAERWLALSGVLFGIAFLLRQPAVLALPATAIWLELSSRVTLRRAVFMGAGFTLPLFAITAGFALFGSFHWFWDANVAYFLYYVPEGSRITSILMLYMFAPSVVVLALLSMMRLRGQPAPPWALPAMWFAFAFVGSLLNGKDYSHYLLQTFPALALLLFALLPSSLPRPASMWRQPALIVAVVFAVSWYVVVNAVFYDTLGRHWTKGPDYYAHVFNYVTGKESRADFNAYFDKRVNTIQALDEYCDTLKTDGETAYIWGEYPWVYAVCDLEPFSRYVTSYYILESDERAAEFLAQLAKDPPAILIIGSDAEPKPNRSPTKERFNTVSSRLQDLASKQYEEVARIGSATVYSLRGAANTVDNHPR